MTRTLRPLFRADVVRDHLRGFILPTGLGPVRARLANLAAAVANARARRLNEEKLKPLWLAEVFGALLGYKTLADSPDHYTMVSEFGIPGGLGSPDAVLGRAPSEGRNVLAVVEVKGPRDPLDIPHGGRAVSAVKQAFDYAINLRCDWIIVTSMAETRLYYKGADQLTCERFDLARMVESDDALRRFLFILGAARVVPEVGDGHLESLLADSRSRGEDVTRAFYSRYSQVRGDMFRQLGAANPAVGKGAVLSATQKLLDRILFCSFAEQRGLLPRDSIKKAFDHIDPYHPAPKWATFKGLFRAINDGNQALGVSKYNGGLFAPDPVLESLAVPDEVCSSFRALSGYDFSAPEEPDGLPPENETSTEGAVDVEILGHIFEQSITDLERLRLEIDGKVAAPEPGKAKAKRKKEGAFYTPEYITRFIVGESLGPVIESRFEALRARHVAMAKGKTRTLLENPRAFDAESLSPAQRTALTAFWDDWHEELARLRILDPACGSGAFLIEAFDQLYGAYQDANAHLHLLREGQELFDLNRQILQQNLYGVDLNDEAVEICRLSLWIKTAEVGKILTDLEHTIRVGNSIVADATVDPRAFDWAAAFPEVMTAGGFDVVIGNPPYIRQEWLAPLKPYLKEHYQVFSGTADLYLFFIERGLSLLKEGGRLGFVTSGTFARGNFAAPFRAWLPGQARFAALINFGENQPFEDAEMVYPTISVLQKRGSGGPPDSTLTPTGGPAANRGSGGPPDSTSSPADGPAARPTTGFPTLFLHGGIPKSLSDALKADRLICDEGLFAESEWRFQPKEVTRLFQKIMAVGRPLAEVCGGRIFYGIKTGYNEAFIIDTPTRDRLVKEDPGCSVILRRILKGEDLRPWYQDWEEKWLIIIPCGYTKEAGELSDANAWKWFQSKHPSIAALLATSEEALRKRQDQGDYWWELRACSYMPEFDAPKILWPDIQKLPRFSWDESGSLVNDQGCIITGQLHSLLAILQSRVVWFCLSQIAMPLRLRGGLWQYRSKVQFIERLPIPQLSEQDRQVLGTLATQITALARERQGFDSRTRHRILTDLGTPGASLNNALTTWWTLDFTAFRGELDKAFGTDIPLRERGEWESALQDWRAEHDRLTHRIITLEEQLNDRVYRLYGLSPGEVQVLEDFQKKTGTFFPLGSV